MTLCPLCHSETGEAIETNKLTKEKVEIIFCRSCDWFELKENIKEEANHEQVEIAFK